MGPSQPAPQQEQHAKLSPELQQQESWIHTLAIEAYQRVGLLPPRTPSASLPDKASSADEAQIETSLHRREMPASSVIAEIQQWADGDGDQRASRQMVHNEEMAHDNVSEREQRYLLGPTSGARNPSPEENRTTIELANLEMSQSLQPPPDAAAAPSDNSISGPYGNRQMTSMPELQREDWGSDDADLL